LNRISLLKNWPRYQQVAATLTSSSDSMKKFAKDMTKQQQL
jgi:hypothetical protein